MFNEIFVKNHYLDDLLNENIYFLIGEKGTGKTAYATFLANNDYKNNLSSLKFIEATDYEKFYVLKKQEQLDLTGYSGIWKVILLLILSKTIAENDQIIAPFSKYKITHLTNAIEEYYNNAFSPEIITILKFLEESDVFAKLVSQVEMGGSLNSSREFSQTKFQTNLLFIEKEFSEALRKIKLNKNINLFIDGIDVRPDSMPYDDYIECIKGLITATWSLNTELFPSIRDSKGTPRIILLLRPDIYNSLNLQNATNKFLDNSVFLDWRTTYIGYPNSYLFKVALKLISFEQECDDEVALWDSYFDWKLPATNDKREYDTAFMSFLSISLSRPRDILTILQFLQRKSKKDGFGDEEKFELSLYRSDEFQNNYSDYFMSSLKDQLSFYYSNVDFEHFLRFFEYFDNKDFDYETYERNYDIFVDYICNYATEIPAYVDDKKGLIQLLYDCNVITAIERKEDSGSAYFHFSYREKSNANINPKVPIGRNISYRFHYGMYKKSKLGRF